MRRRARISEAIEKFSIIKTLQAIEEANVVLMVLDAQQGVGEQDATLAGHVLESGRGLILVVNKWDGLTQDQREWVKSEIRITSYNVCYTKLLREIPTSKNTKMLKFFLAFLSYKT